MDNLEETHRFLEKFNLLRLNQEEIEIMNNLITGKKKKTVRDTNTWILNNTFLNDQEVTEEIKKEIKKFLETNDN